MSSTGTLSAPASALLLREFAVCRGRLHWGKDNWDPSVRDRILVGDSRKVLRDLPSDTVDLIHTSPPYNIEKRYADSSDDLEHGEYIQLLVDVFSECYRLLRPGASLFLQTGYSQDVSVEMVPIDMLSYEAMRNMGYRLWDRIIWHYRGGMSFTRKFKNTHETILWWVKPETTGAFQPSFDVDAVREQSKSYDKRNNLLGKNPGNVWLEDRVAFGGYARNTSHIAIYPESVTERIIRACTRPGQFVLDPFAGSGTTPAMARALGRRWIGIDVSPKYAREAERRIGRKQASEGASLASGLVKMVGFGNKPGRKPFDYLCDALVTWIKGYNSDHYAQIRQDQLGQVFESGLFRSAQVKSAKPSVWRYFDSFFTSGDATHDHLRVVSAALDASYPQRRRWNGVRKYLHSFSVIEDLLGSARGRSTELVQSVVMCEPSSFRLSDRGDVITFRGPPLPIHKNTVGPGHKERTDQPSQVSIFG